MATTNVAASTIAVDDWLYVDRLDGNGPQALHVAAVASFVADEDLATPAQVWIDVVGPHGRTSRLAVAPGVVVQRLEGPPAPS